MRFVFCLAALLLLPSVTARADTVRIGLGPDIDTLDWHKALSANTVLVASDLCEGLVAFGPDGTVVPGVAESWTVSDDGRAYRFKLRSDARWSDGAPVIAGDFVVAWQRMLLPATANSNIDQAFSILNAEAVAKGEAPTSKLGVEAIDDRTLALTLANRQPDLIEALAHPMFCPSPKARGMAGPLREDGLPVTNGAYFVTDRQANIVIRLKRSPHYWNRTKVAIDNVEYHVTEDQQTELKRFRSGELDLIRTVPATQIDWVRENLKDRFHIAPSSGYSLLTPNLTREPWASNVKLRQAVYLAIDRQAITDKVLRSGETPLFSLVTRGMPGYTPAEPDWARWTQAERDAKALALLKEAGFGPDRPLKLEIFYPTGERGRQVNIAIAAMLKTKLGIEVILRNEEAKVVFAQLRGRQYSDLMSLAYSGVTPRTSLELLHGTRSVRGPGYYNPTVDRLLDEARQAPTLEAMNALLREAEAIAVQDVPQIPLMQASYKILVDPRLSGWEPHPSRHPGARFLRWSPAKG